MESRFYSVRRHCSPAWPWRQRLKAQIVVDIGVQPSCAYGYYDYAPYACAPYGYYGPGYFYNGIFLGMGPWAGWGYGHGWGGHRFMRGAAEAIAAAAVRRPIAAILHAAVAAAAGRVPARVMFKRRAPALRHHTLRARFARSAQLHTQRQLRTQLRLRTQLLVAAGRTVVAVVDMKAANTNL